MALTKVSRGLLSTSIVDNGNATAITIDSSENVTFSGTVTADGLTLGAEGDQIIIPTTNSGIKGIITTGDSIFGNAFEFKNGNGIAIVSDTNDSAVTGGVDATLIARGSSATKTALFDVNGDVSFYEDSGTTPKMVWDSSAERLTVSGSGAGILTLDRGASSNQIKFANAGSTLGYFGYLDGTGFSIAGSDGGSDVVVDASGNLLVNRTSVFTTAKMEIQSDAGDASTLALNSIDTDGSILEFYKAGTAVGSINNFSSTEFGLVSEKNLVLTQNTTTERNLVFSSSYFGSFGADDATIDLGRSVGRFKDLYLSNQIIGGFGAATTSGTADWNHSTNARSGMGHTLLLGTATNGPGPSAYFHATSFEYQTKDGTGNMTQLAIGYNTNRIFMRYRYNNSWTAWVEK
jgi:hypothetical protein